MKTSWSLTALWRGLRWHRRAVGVLALIIAGLCAAAIASAPEPAGTPVVVTTRTLAPGTVVGPGDVAVVSAPAELIPDGALTSVDEAIGATVTAGQPAGVMLTALALSGVSGLTDASAGEVLVPVRLADPEVAALLHVGTIISVVANGTDGQTSVIARHVRVAVLPAAAADSGLFGGMGGSDRLIVVAADPEQAQELAGAYGSSLGVLIE